MPGMDQRRTQQPSHRQIFRMRRRHRLQHRDGLFILADVRIAFAQQCRHARIARLRFPQRLELAGRLPPRTLLVICQTQIQAQARIVFLRQHRAVLLDGLVVAPSVASAAPKLARTSTASG